MTTAAERSRTAKRNVAAGKLTERMVADYLTDVFELDDDHRIVRAVRTGTAQTADPGDLARLPAGLICSIKYAVTGSATGRLRTHPERWMGELDEMDGPAGSVRFLVVRKPHIEIDAWDVFVRAGVLASLVMAAAFGERDVTLPWARRALDPAAPEPIRTLARVNLAPWARMLRDAGYGGSREGDHGSG
jgi:hypothetical protein